MTRYECLQLLAARMTDQLVVTSQSGQRIEWSHLTKHEGNLLVGMMGCAIGVAAGLALALPHRKVLALDSDGSVLLSLYSGSRISYPTATAGNTDLAAMARAAGIKNAHTIRDVEDFTAKGLDALSQNQLAFLVCKVEESLMHREIPRPNTDLAENKYTFVRYLERTEGKAIPFIGRG
jgi:thiamine pyrophosphate-dependent acetolactate synthase large subunit-like protein